MKKLKLIKVISSLLIAASVLAFAPIGASAAWKQDSNGWWYTEDNSYAKGWDVIDGKWYYFESSGYMAHDTTIDGYKLGSDGALSANRIPVSTITQWTTSTNAESTSSINTSKDEMVEVTVENAKELVNAIGSNKRIILKPGVYNLSNIKQVNNIDNSVIWKNVYDGKELNIQNIHDLTIEGMGPGQVEINIDSRYAEIMNFNNVSNVTIKNIIAGHTPEPYHCNAGVLSFHNSTDISIMNSELYGCGSVGLSLGNVKGLNASKCIIDHCSFEALRINGCEDIKFTENKIIDHEAYGNIIDISGSKDIIFEKCELSGNNNFEYGFIGVSGADLPYHEGSNVLLDKCIIKNNSRSSDTDFNVGKTCFFSCGKSSKITVKDSEVSGNKCDYLKDSSESVKFENCTFNNNVWR
ncbi:MULTISPECIES: right-handed parallel beta-helix repeat-containing protein [Clostridium]|uniref:Right-handed parallel beta-helix repeat-containing protein n=1 Tax=Clostridium aquiflavi TaxID=3073603 RepID=A0ABU1EGQ1_9CLOT|nr:MULTISPECIES: right-handed parallel beta-helix repeat-containing protein [unclassified Clostridium]MDR5587540.1 right-handed parallel beta-helix repeat-containing protein [Clostridium sp. 5N-1]